MTPVGNGAGPPKFGLILPASLQEELPNENGSTTGSTPCTAANLAELCRQAEATGADSLWAVDHLFWPHPINECLATLAVAAASTTGPTLGSCILQLPLRRASAVAKQATTLQNLSGGRLVLGLGVGSHAAEYARAGVDFYHRGRLMDEGIAALRRAWEAGDASYRQEPTSPRIPLWIGGSSPAARRRAAAVGDGWVPLFVLADEYGPALERLRQESREAGRGPDAVEPAIVVFVRVGPEDEAHHLGSQWLSAMYGVPAKAFNRHLVAGPPESCAAELARYAEAGARHVIVMVAAPGAVQHFDLLRPAFMRRTAAIPVGVTG